MSVTVSGSVLVVHHDGETRDRLVRFTRQIGYTVMSVPDGSAAVETVAAQPIGLVLYHLDPRNMADLGAFARVRELPDGTKLAIVAFTDSEQLAKARQFGLALGIRDYLFDPLKDLEVKKLFGQLNPLKADDARGSGDGVVDMSGAVTIAELRAVHARVAKQTHFERLDVDPMAPGADVRKAYMALVKRYSPDAVGGTEARRLLRDVYDALGEAYRTLRDDGRREEYGYQRERKKRAVEPEPAEFARLFPIFFNSAAAPLGSPLRPLSSHCAWMQGPQVYDHAGASSSVFKVLRSVVRPEASWWLQGRAQRLHGGTSLSAQATHTIFPVRVTCLFTTGPRANSFGHK